MAEGTEKGGMSDEKTSACASPVEKPAAPLAGWEINANREKLRNEWLLKSDNLSFLDWVIRQLILASNNDNNWKWLQLCHLLKIPAHSNPLLVEEIIEEQSGMKSASPDVGRADESSEQTAHRRLQGIAQLIRTLEGLPVEYGLAMNLSVVLKDIEARPDPPKGER